MVFKRDIQFLTRTILTPSFMYLSYFQSFVTSFQKDSLKEDAPLKHPEGSCRFFISRSLKFEETGALYLMLSFCRFICMNPLIL